MKCHYEVLNVKQDVNDSDLKKAYRKLALLWHPDKNPNNSEEAHNQFQLIQNAYEVLSDPQERAFYDRNRDSILHGKDSDAGSKINTVNLYAYFNTSCYSGFDDSDRGFYTVYRKVFESIKLQDMPHMPDEDEVCIPTFGHSDSDLKDVAGFYNYWSGYCTSMPFTWHNVYDIKQAPNRWVEKKIEQENKKARDKAKRKYNEEVRSLVAFVKRRDKRNLLIKKQIEDRLAENLRKQENREKARRDRRIKNFEKTMEEQKESLQLYEEELKAMEAQFASEWNISEDESTEDDASLSEAEIEAIGELYCVACNKVFKSDKAFENHSLSRKHKENIEYVKIQMRKQENEFQASKVDESSSSQQQQQENGLLSDSELNNEPILGSNRKKKKKKKPFSSSTATPDVSDYIVGERRGRKKQQPLKFVSSDEAGKLTGDVSVDAMIKESDSRQSHILQCDSNDSSCPVPSAQDGKNNTNVCNGKLQALEVELDAEQDSNKKNRSNNESKKKDKQKKTQQPNQVEAQCSVCHATFPSKNKLFIHIKTQGHAAFKNVDEKHSGKRTKKKK